MKVRGQTFYTVAALLLMSGNAFAEGAIAVNDTEGSKPSDAGYGIGYGDTRQTAESAAMKKCKDAGNDSCKVVVWYKKCGAYASSNDKYGIGYGTSESTAKSTAMEQCGSNACRIVASDCSDD